MSVLRILLLSLLMGCTPGAGRLQVTTLRSPVMGRVMEHAVYVPPGWSRSESLPLVVFLHGAGDSHTALETHGVTAALDRAIETEQIPRVVILAPNGELGFWANWYDGSHRYADWVLDELIPNLRRELGTRPCPEGCHVIGISMGAAGALRWAMWHPERFASASVISAPIFDTDALMELTESILARVLMRVGRVIGPPQRERLARADPFVQWQTPADLRGVRLIVAWGDEETGDIGETNARLTEHLTTRGIPYHHEIFSGGHDWPAWTPVILRAVKRAVQESVDGS